MALHYSNINDYEFDPVNFRKQVLMSYKNKKFKDNFFGPSPSPFIGRFNYPNVNIGFLSLDERKDASLHDSPREWSKLNFKIRDVAERRIELINSRTVGNIKRIERMSELTQQIGLASKPVDVEVSLKKKPSNSFRLDKYTPPIGPTASLKRVVLTENPKIHTKVEKAHADTDLKATSAISELYKGGIDENILHKALSVGSFGIGKNRKLVPTRWSITATDDIIGKDLIKKIKDYKESDFQAYYGGYLGNDYLILLLPGIWSFELFEIFPTKINEWGKEKLNYATDFEFYDGRKTYAQETAGGYYASRLGVLELLNKLKRQASVLVFRFISDAYSLPLGVWVVREASRKSVSTKPLVFSDLDLLLNYASTLSRKKYNFNISNILKNSRILNETKRQKRLFEF